MSKWISVKESLPEPDKHVLIYFKNLITVAIYLPGKYKIDDEDCQDISEYHEENDAWYWPEGWYEYQDNPVDDDYCYVFYSYRAPTHWQPLPAPPKD